MYRIAGWTFTDKKSVLPLQAADALAYEAAKEMENGVVDGRKRPIRKSAQDLVRPRDDLQYWNYERIVRSRDKVRNEKRHRKIG